MNKFKVGDKVKVIKYGSLIFYHKEAYFHAQEYFNSQPSFLDILLELEPVNKPYVRTPPKNIIEETKDKFIVDMMPQLVGKTGIIDGSCSSGYSIDGIEGKHAWYNEEQLELIK